MMFRGRRWACSFCGKGEAEVAKLVAGPKVYICDECVAVASRIMESHPTPPAPELGRWRQFWRRVRGQTYLAAHAN